MQVSGSQLKKFLKHFDITQDEAAKSLKVSRQTVNNWCKQEFLDNSVLQLVKTTYKEFDDYLGGNKNIKEYQRVTGTLVAAERKFEYNTDKSDIRLLLEQNAQLVKNNTTLVETINKISEELINLHRESKNAHARGDVGCADVG